jgi:hypothetical protein
MKERLWQVCFMLLIMAGFVFGGLVAQDNTPAKVVRSERFEVVNSSGRVVGIMGLDQNDPGTLCLRDRFSRNRIVAKVNPDETVSIQCLGSAGELMGSLPRKGDIVAAIEGTPGKSASESGITYSANPTQANTHYPPCASCKGKPIATVKCPVCVGSGAGRSDDPLDAKESGRCKFCEGRGVMSVHCAVCRGTGHKLGQVTIGMTSQQLQDALGEPDSVDTTISAAVHGEVWHFSELATISMSNGKVSLIEYRRDKP